ncbi:putative RNA-directed DNA polymerase from transposon BS [Pseudolycoriella hygida]|uniref:RNA-directed DNA polymerase from transposon BS n=1 Tax=Pseudolycoriella hygida TaxID=35572 RepID=A0A9Q0NB86_9DIPT|nr:putative RNA-directed DNA polymerase from transposon BS [Pseudolycoriella hygida]
MARSTFSVNSSRTFQQPSRGITWRYSTNDPKGEHIVKWAYLNRMYLKNRHSAARNNANSVWCYPIAEKQHYNVNFIRLTIIRNFRFINDMRGNFRFHRGHLYGKNGSQSGIEQTDPNEIMSDLISTLKTGHELIFAFSKTAVDLISSYLSNRPEAATVGVPQGSVFSPLLFTVFTNDLPNVLSFMTPHMFADDVKAYIESLRDNVLINECVARVNRDLEAVCKWARRNGLQLNGGKTK